MYKMVGQAVRAAEAVTTGTRQPGNPGTDITCPVYWTFVLSLPSLPSQYSSCLGLKAASPLAENVDSYRMWSPIECGPLVECGPLIEYGAL